jgi:sugar phosphate isomerase/epimerase
MLLTVPARACGLLLEEQLANAAAAGFEALELRGEVDGVPLTSLDTGAFADLCHGAAALGLTVATLALGTVEELAGNPDGLRRVGELSALVGARVRLLSANRPGVHGAAEARGEPPEMLFEREVELWRACLAALREGNPGALVMIEGRDIGVCNTVARQERLLAALADPMLGYNWDFVACWRGGEHPWPGAWPRLAGRIYGVHYQGAKADPHDPSAYACHALPGDDDIPHRSLWATLAAVGFDGPVTVDPHYQHFGVADRFDPAPDNPTWELCTQTLAKMQDYRRRAWERLC